MHPNPAFRSDNRALARDIVEEVGFGMVFAATPDGPRVVHTPLVMAGDNALRFHVSRGNALAKWLDRGTALALVNGPDGYISPRWYSDQGTVPTWDYVAIEMEGRVRKLGSDDLLTLLETLSARHEARIEGAPWTMDKLPEPKKRALLGGITGYEMEIQAWRPTFKLSQNKPPEERERVAAGLDGQGARAIAALIRSLAP